MSGNDVISHYDLAFYVLIVNAMSIIVKYCGKKYSRIYRKGEDKYMYKTVRLSINQKRPCLVIWMSILSNCITAC